jgi:hypothetical protein
MGWRGTRILHENMTFSKKLPEFQMGLRFDVASDQLRAQPRSRSKNEKKTSHNIEQHLYGFDID